MLDAHVHFWSIARGDYEWLSPQSGVLYRDYLPEDIAPRLAEQSVSGVIAVQAAGTIAETQYLLRLAERNRFIRGVVGWLDLQSTDFEERYSLLSESPFFCGIRLNGDALQATDAASFDQLIHRAARLADDGKTVDVLLSCEELSAMLPLLAAVPQLKLVVNHLGVPPANEETYESWEKQMRAIAGHARTACKLSGMITRQPGIAPEQMRDYVAALLEWFGYRRLLYGSDWPVCLQQGSYAQTMQFFLTMLPDGLDELAIKHLTSLNASAFYLNGSGSPQAIEAGLQRISVFRNQRLPFSPG